MQPPLSWARLLAMVLTYTPSEAHPLAYQREVANEDEDKGNKILELRHKLQWYYFYIIKELQDCKRKKETNKPKKQKDSAHIHFYHLPPKFSDTGSAKKDQKPKG